MNNTNANTSANTSPINKLEITNRLERQGLRAAADAYREEVRLRLMAEANAGAGVVKKDRAAAVAQSWVEMWENFGPIIARAEAKAELAKAKAEAEKAKAKAQAEAQSQPEPPAPQLAGLPPFSEALLDLDYTERDPGRQLRDSLLWAAMEWQRVISDTDSGPVANLEAASTPPPTPFALFVLATYALGNLDKRRELITRALAFAVKSHDEIIGDADADTDEQPGGFLDSIK